LGCSSQCPDSRCRHHRCDLELESIRSFKPIHADEFDLVALWFIVNQRPIEIRIRHNRFHFFFTQSLRIFFSVPGLDLPARLSVISVNGSHTLKRKFFAHGISPLVFLSDDRLESATADILAGAAQCLYSLNLFHAPDSLKVTPDNLIHGLRGNGQRESCKDDQQESDSAHGFLLQLTTGTLRFANTVL